MYEIITYVSDPALARVLIAALPGVVAPRGIPIRVPDEEAVEGKILAEDLLKDMLKR